MKVCLLSQQTEAEMFSEGKSPFTPDLFSNKFKIEKKEKEMNYSLCISF